MDLTKLHIDLIFSCDWENGEYVGRVPGVNKVKGEERGKLFEY